MNELGSTLHNLNMKMWSHRACGGNVVNGGWVFDKIRGSEFKVDGLITLQGLVNSTFERIRGT